MNSHSHTPVPHSFQRLTSQVFLLFGFSVSKPKSTVAMERGCRFVSCTTVPSISMYNQELTGGGRGDREKGAREGERKRENAQIFKI